MTPAGFDRAGEDDRAPQDPAQSMTAGAAPDGATPEGAAPDGATPDGAAPDTTSDGATSDSATSDGAAPDSARGGAAPDSAEQHAGTGPDGAEPGGAGPHDADTPDAEGPDAEAPAADAPDADRAPDADMAPDAAAGKPARRSVTTGIPGLDPGNAGPGAAAFFDVDNTMMKGSSFVALARGMADRDYFTTAEILEFTWKQLKYVVSGRENLGDIAQATENGLQFVKGREPREIRELADEVYDETMVRRLWSGSLELAEAHRALGHEVWLVSATPAEVAEVIARRLGLTGGLGTVAEVVDGVYSGKLLGAPLHGSAKVDAIRRLAAQRGLDLSRCAAYSDSSNDIPMLSEVGYPVAVNPDGTLRAHAKRRDWPIRDYRLRGRDSVRRGVPAAAAASAAVGVAIGVAKAVSAIREPGSGPSGTG